jgi:hypothetical protein
MLKIHEEEITTEMYAAGTSINSKKRGTLSPDMSGGIPGAGPPIA